MPAVCMWPVGPRCGRSVGSGGLATPAGTGVASGPLGVGGPAARADLSTCGVAVDRFGNLVIADVLHDQIAVVAAKTGMFYGQAMTAGDIYAVAGDGRQGVSGPGAVATQTALGDPVAVAVDANGNLVISESGFSSGGRVRGGRLQAVAAASGTFYGKPMTAEHIYAVAGNGTLGFSGDGGPGHEGLARRESRGRAGGPRRGTCCLPTLGSTGSG